MSGPARPGMHAARIIINRFPPVSEGDLVLVCSILLPGRTYRTYIVITQTSLLRACQLRCTLKAFQYDIDGIPTELLNVNEAAHEPVDGVRLGQQRLRAVRVSTSSVQCLTGPLYLYRLTQIYPRLCSALSSS